MLIYRDKYYGLLFRLVLVDNTGRLERRMPRSVRSCALPKAIAAPLASPVTPSPVIERNELMSAGVTFRSIAPDRIAALSGCSLFFSRPAANDSICSSVQHEIACTVIKRGLPCVNVPVLSTTSVSTFRRVSIASPFRNRTPIEAPLPGGTIIDIGVAKGTRTGNDEYCYSVY